MGNILKGIFITAFGFCNSLLVAQVGINTESAKSTLDLHKNNLLHKADGFMTVRISGDEIQVKDDHYGKDQNTAIVYATSAPSKASAKTSNIIQPGFYYYNSNASKWMNFNLPKFFSLPSNIDTSIIGTYTKDLYDLYYDQFSNPIVKSEGSIGKVPFVDKNDLEYYITHMDKKVLTDVTIDADGLMTYTVSDDTSDSSHLNIVFVVK